MRTICTMVVAILIAGVSVWLSSIWFWLGLASFLALMMAFVYNAIQEVPASPPNKAVLVFVGRRRNVVLNEGWNWVPLYPIVFRYILVDIAKKVSQFGPQNVRTPDNALISTSEAVIWIPGIVDHPNSYITYLNSGGKDGVERILRERMEDRVKTWGSSNQEGPSTWKEALGLRDDAHSVLAKALLGVPPLTKVDSQIPTGVWMRFLAQPQSPPTAYDMRPENGWASLDENGRWNWAGLQVIFNAYAEEERDTLKSQVELRRKEINDLRGARGNFEDESLGITIKGFSVNEIEAKGKAAEAADAAERERLEAEADTTEIENVSARIAHLRKQHPEMSVEDAVRLVQTERGKATRVIIDVVGAQTGLGHDLLGLGALVKGINLGDANESGGRGGKSNRGRNSGGGQDDDASENKRAMNLRKIAQKNQDDLDAMGEDEEK